MSAIDGFSEHAQSSLSGGDFATLAQQIAAGLLSASFPAPRMSNMVQECGLIHDNKERQVFSVQS